MAQRGENRSAIGVADEFHSVTIKPYLSSRRNCTRAGSGKKDRLG